MSAGSAGRQAELRAGLADAVCRPAGRMGGGDRGGARTPEREGRQRSRTPSHRVDAAGALGCRVRACGPGDGAGGSLQGWSRAGAAGCTVGPVPAHPARCGMCCVLLSRVLVSWSLVCFRYVIVRTRLCVCVPCARAASAARQGAHVPLIGFLST